MQRFTKGCVCSALLGIGVFAVQANAAIVNKIFFDGSASTGAAGSLTNNAWTSIGTAGDTSTSVADPTASGGTYWNLNDASSLNSMRFIKNTNGVDTMNQTGSRNMQIARIRVTSGTTQGSFGNDVAGNTTAMTMGVRGVLSGGFNQYVTKDGVTNSTGTPGNTNVTGGTVGIWRVYAFAWLGNLNAAGGRSISTWYLNDAGVAATGGQWSSNPAHWTAGNSVPAGTVGSSTGLPSAGLGGLYIGSSTDDSATINYDIDWIGWTRDDSGGITGGPNDGNQQLPWNISGVPVPEPMTLSMLALGSIPLAMRRRRVA